MVSYQTDGVEMPAIKKKTKQRNGLRPLPQLMKKSR